MLPALYDDGGFSGGTMERPALKRLIADIEAGQIDVVVVYKVDRLMRALSDFAKLVDVFDRRGVSFVSITQQFNTTTSMGRLTLNVLLSFAQFEREVTGERIRDKVAASKKKGMWMGGMPPLGYDVKNRKLVVNDAEARIVVKIYRRYLALKSVHALRDELADARIKSKRRLRPDGAEYGGQTLSRGALSRSARRTIWGFRISGSSPLLDGYDEPEKHRLAARSGGELCKARRRVPQVQRNSEGSRGVYGGPRHHSEVGRTIPQLGAMEAGLGLVRCADCGAGDGFIKTETGVAMKGF